VFVSSASSELV